MIDYFIKVLLFQLLFLAVYDLLLKRETFFQWNRAYLLFTSLLAYLIPFLKFYNPHEILPQGYVVQLPEILLSPTVTIKQHLEEPTLFFNAFHLIFWIGIAVASLLFVLKLYHIFKLISSHEKQHKQKYWLVLLEKNSAFSFFKYLFLGKNIPAETQQQIIEHELVHIRQKHSVDLLFFEMQRIVFWFNPFSYLYQQRISELHEFIADAKAIKDTNSTLYFNKLLLQTFDTTHTSFINPFFKHSLLKKRIQMFRKNKSKQVLKLKYLLLIPVTILMVFFSIKLVAQKNSTAKTKEKSYELSLVKKSPIYPGCENITSQYEIRKCLSENIYTHFKENFDFTLLKTSKDKRKMVYIGLLIGKNGKTTATIFTEDEKVKKEALHLVSELSTMTPGIRKGENVAVRFSVFINYSNDKIRIKSGTGPYLIDKIVE
jgi:beta-lactamase regulating signal transducer with metallopeptidase domain